MSRLEVIGLTQGQLPRDGEVKIGFGLEEGTRNLSEGNCQNQTYLGASQGERHFTQIWGNKGKYPTRKFTSWAQRKGFARVQLIHMVLEGKLRQTDPQRAHSHLMRALGPSPRFSVVTTQSVPIILEKGVPIPSYQLPHHQQLAPGKMGNQ